MAKHATARDCWLVISGGVYDVTGYLSDHPGGEDVMLDMAGTWRCRVGERRRATPRRVFAPPRHRCARPAGGCRWGGDGGGRPRR